MSRKFIELSSDNKKEAWQSFDNNVRLTLRGNGGRYQKTLTTILSLVQKDTNNKKN